MVDTDTLIVITAKEISSLKILNCRMDFVLSLVLSTEMRMDYSSIVSMVLSLNIMNMKKAAEYLNLVKMLIILSAIGGGTLPRKPITSVARR